MNEMRGFDESLPMALLAARESAMRRFRPMLADHDLTEQQWRVLRALSAESAPIDVGGLAERTALLAPSVTRILAALTERGLVDRTMSVDDQRRAELRLSPLGETIVATVAPHSEAIYQQVEDAFGAARLSKLITELHDFAHLLNEGT